MLSSYSLVALFAMIMIINKIKVTMQQGIFASQTQNQLVRLTKLAVCKQ